MSVVLALGPIEVGTIIIAAVLRAEVLVRRPGRDQRAIDRKVRGQGVQY
jgi:hypothetical protein